MKFNCFFHYKDKKYCIAIVTEDFLEEDSSDSEQAKQLAKKKNLLVYFIYINGINPAITPKNFKAKKNRFKIGFPPEPSEQSGLY